MTVEDSTNRDVDDPDELAPHQTELDSDTPFAPSLFETGKVEDFQLKLPSTSFALPFQLGDYRLSEKVGEGGAGIVYRAQSSGGQKVVAVKVLRPDVVASSTAVRRFMKESRLHAEIESDFVTRHIEFGAYNGLYFMVSEFVEGVSLREIVNQFGKLECKEALRIIVDVLKALDALHSKEVIHRDVKPGNVLAVLDAKVHGGDSISEYRRFKLTDFGLARHVEQSESMAMTEQRAVLGTPMYMAPEQHSESRLVDARADIYSVGATLYQLLTGQPPFLADDVATMARLHREEKPRSLSKFDSEISEAIENVVGKALEKEPELRYANAGEMLADIQRIMEGKPTSIRLYPTTPDKDKQSSQSYVFEWNLNAPASSLWPLVSDTNRFNKAIGLPVPEFSYQHNGDQRQVFANASFKGMKVRWREHPFQWIRERTLSVLREFESGPFEWVTSTVDLDPLIDNRTRVTHRFQVKPRGLFGKWMTSIQFGLMTKRGLDRVYQRLEQLAADSISPYACHAPFGKPIKLTSKQQKCLDERSGQLAKSSGGSIADRFANYLQTVSDSTVSRIQPVLLADDLGCSPQQSLNLCVNAVAIGLLKMSWDVICPVCRIAARNVTTMSQIEAHSSCDFCNLEFEVDFGKSVELVFGVHPEIRKVDVGTYCIGGPFHMPHVIAQSRLMAGEQVEIGTGLDTGNYQVRGPQLNRVWSIVARVNAFSRRTDIELAKSASDTTNLATGQVCVNLKNDTDAELLARFEQKTERAHAVTAAQAVKHPLFQKLFPTESIVPSQLVDRENLHLLAIWDACSEETIAEIGEIAMRSNWGWIGSCFSSESDTNNSLDGSVIERSHDSLILAFERQSDLANRLISFEQAIVERSELKREQFSFAIGRGELMIGSEAEPERFFGLALRKFKSMVTLMKTHSSVLVIQSGLRNDVDIRKIIASLANESEPSEIVDDEFDRYSIKH